MFHVKPLHRYKKQSMVIIGTLCSITLVGCTQSSPTSQVKDLPNASSTSTASTSSSFPTSTSVEESELKTSELEATKDSSPKVLKENDNPEKSDNVLQLSVGNCYNTSYKNSEQKSLVENINIVDCADSHAAEVYAEKELQYLEYPGQNYTQGDANKYCRTEFRTFYGGRGENTNYSLTYLTPTKESWNNSGDRKVLCIVLSPELRTGSLAGGASIPALPPNDINDTDALN